ncbi:OB-fold domain-containing protein [Roseiarcaceae bacterium H3SJ34-1]|uniref:Zn-ribbon domain-containing OB-fold protein n=1 Tax=Terripilifer ovatus TaxID=3032367 RepID=UPI003AB96229|nr:OB-fold domain-containing protein [Roseiarcaceae bacterium H3SJ34-1]
MTTSPTDLSGAVLPVRPYPGQAALARLVIPPSGSTRTYHDGLAAGRLMLQRCSACGRCRVPMAPVCPYCDGEAADWIAASGRGQVVSFVRYARAHLPEFEAIVPYTVLCVQLAEGPRMFGRLAGSDTAWIGQGVAVIIEQWVDGGRAPAFVSSGGAG